MEAAYDKNNSNSVFDNDSSHFKFTNMDTGFNNSSDTSVSNDAEACQMISPPTVGKNCYNESNDVLITEESVDVVDNHQKFEDDFGPETDVDAMDETNFMKSPLEAQENHSIKEFSLSNGNAPFSLENKIMQQLSEQNRDYLTDSNPFKNDNFDQYSDDHAILDQTTKVSGDSPADVVDNKIIDALESLAVSNGENEKNEFEDGKLEGDLLDIRQQFPETPDLTEKADYNHEKNLFMFSSAAESDDPCMQHSETTFNQTEEQKLSLVEQDDTPSLADTRCVDESIGEESEEEEEDEWNYIKGDKKSEERPKSTNLEEKENLSETDAEQSPEIQPNEPVAEPIDEIIVNTAEETQPSDFTLVDTAEKESSDDNEKNDKIKEDIVQSEDAIANEEKPEFEEPKDQQQDIAVSIEQELADYENNSAVIAPTEAEHLPEKPDIILSNEEDISPVEAVEECSSSSDIAPEVVAEETTFTDIVAEKAPSTEITSMNIVAEETPSAENLVEEAPVEKQSVEEQLSEVAKETSAEPELERPDSLSFEMASKLNPEAKEFVPVSSPTRSTPTSPVGNAPSAVPNAFLMLDDDAVVAQSPKKFTSTMDNIDVPAEDDFQNEMNNRPHELEKPSEYINGNADVSVRSHSPISEPSYQEMNMKEAMQADEKLEHDYNDDKQVIIENSPSDTSNEQNILNALKQDPMNMSFYEGRDEALLSNSDELNKVHMLPEDDDIEQQTNGDTDQVDECEATESKQVIQLEDKMEITDVESKSQPEFEEVLESKSPAPEESTAAIYAVASQVVNDVAALVDQMQIESPVVNDVDLDHDDEQIPDAPAQVPTETTSDDATSEENRDILISLEHQSEMKPLEDATLSEQHTESPSPIPVENVSAPQAEESASALIETLQQEVVAENESVTDESVLNIQPASQPTVSAETLVEPSVEEPSNELLISAASKNHVEPVAELIETAVTENLQESVAPVLEQVECSPDTEKVIEDTKESKPVVAEAKSATVKPIAAKPLASKTTAPKTTKPVTPTTDKKTTTTARPTAKPATAKPSAALKQPPTTTVKKTSTASNVSSAKTVSSARTSTASTVGRTSTVGSVANKLSTEKKAPLAAKKPTTVAVNGDVKPIAAAKKPLAPKTTITKSSTTSSSSATSARPSSTSVKSTTTKSSTTTTRTTTTAPVKSCTTTATRPSSTVPAAKPRTAPSTASKTVSSTSTSTVGSKSSSSTVTKRVSTVGPTTVSRTTTATNKTTTAAKTTSSMANRTSTVSKVSSTTTATGVRKTTGPSPTKKPISSPMTKTSSAKAATPTKASGLSNGTTKDKTEPVITNDLLDLDKQLKNDNNQLITNNGIDSQMMVIDSAVD